MNELFYSHIEKNDINEKIILELEKISSENGEQIYILNRPLGEGKYSYEYQENALVLLKPSHKIIFINLGNNIEDFNDYCEDFVEDLSSLSDKFDYKSHIGRPREWKNELIVKLDKYNGDIKSIINENKITDKNKQRKCELLISLLIGSINNIDKIGCEEPDTLLDKIKKKIILFDGEQTRFIYREIESKHVNIQGLSGTGKTELLLHKLKEIYMTTNDKIFLTCHNRILAKNIKNRIPDFFNFMKVQKQIEWEKRLWVGHGWGSQSIKDSGVYTYICNFYNLEYSRFNKYTMNFDIACKKAIESLKKIKEEAKEKFEYAFDYILIDESQDFPKSFFELCDLVTSKKIYIAGDIFQNIFEYNIGEKIVSADFILNRCYRTDPRTLMFAQALGMGLFETQKYNWLTDVEWEGSGYDVNREHNQICLSRSPIRRFEDLGISTISSVVIKKIDRFSEVIKIIQQIRIDHPTVQPDDIAIIFLDTDNYIYEIADKLEHEIYRNFEWITNKGYESKSKIEDAIFISNRNNVKGLEFPFVICITNTLQNNLQYRNTIYTMLTRSFIQSYLLIGNEIHANLLTSSLNSINENNCIKISEPTKDEIENIKKTIITQNKENISYEEFLHQIFTELKISNTKWNALTQALEGTSIERFDRERTMQYIKNNKGFY